MSVKVLQQEVDDWAQTLKTPYWAPLSLIAALVEEVGELSRIYNHRYGDKPKKPTEAPDDLEGELSDVLLNVICIANSEGIDLDHGFRKMMDKIHTRDKDRFELKET